MVRLAVLATLLLLGLVALAADRSVLAQVLLIASLTFAMGEFGRWLNRRFNPVEDKFEDHKRELAAAREAALEAHEADRLRHEVNQQD